MSLAGGTIVALAATQGQRAIESGLPTAQNHGLFTGFLLEGLLKPNWDILEVFHWVREQVSMKSLQKQTPYLLVEQPIPPFYFQPLPQLALGPPALDTAPAPQATRVTIAEPISQSSSSSHKKWWIIAGVAAGGTVAAILATRGRSVQLGTTTAGTKPATPVTRDHFLARPGFARDQHGRVRAGPAS